MAPDPSTSLRPVPRRRIARRAIQVVLVFATCALVANALVGESGLLATRTASRQQARLAERIAALKGENDVLREQVRRLKEDPGIIEEIAREDLGLIRPGEHVFILRTVPEASDRTPPRP